MLAPREIPTENDLNELAICAYIHCSKCCNERPDGQSASEWARFNVGFTRWGIQVWCVRHDCNVYHVDFEGEKHPHCCHIRSDGSGNKLADFDQDEKALPKIPQANRTTR